MFADYFIFQVLFKEVKNKVKLLNHYGSSHRGKKGYYKCQCLGREKTLQWDHVIQYVLRHFGKIYHTPIIEKSP